MESLLLWLRVTTRVVLAIDELPILVNRLLKGDTDHVTPEGRVLADTFLSWLRRNTKTKHIAGRSP